MTRPPRAPTWRGRAGELRAVREPVRLVVRSRRLTARGTSTPTSVAVLPGFGTDDRSTIPLRRFLRRVGHRPHGWGLGTNGGDLWESVPAFIARAEALADEAGTPIALVGWSLGGLVARETARERADLVSQLVTFGTPLLGPRYTSAAGHYDPAELDRLEGVIARRSRRPITRPVTVVYSRRDGIVDWTTCIDRETPGVVNIEVGSTHVGMGIDPDVWTIIADALDEVRTDPDVADQDRS